MIIVDAHCDTLLELIDNDSDLYRGKTSLDIERMQTAGSYVQFFAAFIHPSYNQAYSMKRAMQIIDTLYKQLDKYNDHITLCCNYNEILTSIEQNKVAVILSIEDGSAFQGDLSALRMFYRLGVRSVCLTWNHRNEIADGAAEETSKGGLTTFGINLVREMNRLGMLVDVSHISERGFWDVMEVTQKPIIASHSNAKKICNHRRNLTDDQILAIKKNGGVIGVNFYPPFLSEDGTASLEDIIRHIEYVSGLAGCDTVGIGSDFDGIEYTPADVTGVQDMHKVFEKLLSLNYPEECVKKIAGGNFLRVIKETL